jgi:hypothetical protein
VNRLKAAAILLPFLSAVALCILQVTDWGVWGENPSAAAPGLWRAFGWLLYPFAMTGFLLLPATVWIWSQLAPVATALVEPEKSFILVLGLLFTIYLLFRGTSVMAGDLWRATCPGAAVFILLGLASFLMVKGSGDGQAGLALVIGQNGGLVAGLLLVEGLLRFRRQSAAN